MDEIKLLESRLIRFETTLLNITKDINERMNRLEDRVNEIKEDFTV